jgi:ABC-type glutathione transport system ATPase component
MLGRLAVLDLEHRASGRLCKDPRDGLPVLEVLHARHRRSRRARHRAAEVLARSVDRRRLGGRPGLGHAPEEAQVLGIAAHARRDYCGGHDGGTGRWPREALTGRSGTVEAVRGVDLRVEAGEVFGFLGPNGAGKSTTVKMLTTLLSITSGSASVAGVDVASEPDEVRRRIRVALQ